MILPNSLDCDFHILLFTTKKDELKDKKKKFISNSKTINEFTTDIKTMLNSFNKPYKIIFELVISEHGYHERCMFFNYKNIFCDKGISVFEIHKKDTVKERTKFESEDIFKRFNPIDGDTGFEINKETIGELYTIYITVLQNIRMNYKTEFNMIKGDCNSDKTLNNRLLNNIKYENKHH